jgi:hypothetical protein
LFEEAMRPTLLTGMLLVLALGGAAAPARAATPSLDRLVLSARTTACTTGEEAVSRAAAFTGTMPPLAGTRRMQMRFVLVQRLGAKRPFQRVEVPGWGGWEKSDPGRPGFVFTKRVESLVAPASYRAEITFRWVGKKGHSLRTTTRATGTCVQPDPRPDLVLGGLDVAPKGADQAVYTLAVDNDGHSTAGVFTVTISVDGVVQPPLTLGPLAVGERRHGTIVGTRCSAGSMVMVTVDSGAAVDESVEDDDIVQRPCSIG